MTTLNTPLPTRGGRGWNIGLWAAQIALAALYAMAAYMHGIMSPDALAQMGAVWVKSAPLALVRFIGIMEFLGVLGVILPALTRIKPSLTLWSAAGLLGIQVLAIPFHMIRAEFAPLPFNLIYFALAAFVLWGRSRKAPINARP